MKIPYSIWFIRIWMLFGSQNSYGNAAAEKERNSNNVLNEVEWWNISPFFHSIYDAGLQGEKIKEILKKDFKWKADAVVPEKLLSEKMIIIEDVFNWHFKTVQNLHRRIVGFLNKMKSMPEVKCGNFSRPNIGDIGCTNGTASTIPREEVLSILKESLSASRHVKDLHVAFEDGWSFFYPSILSNFRKPHSNFVNIDSRKRPWYAISKLSKPRDVIIFLHFEESYKELCEKTLKQVVELMTPDDKFLIASDILKKEQAIERHVYFNNWIIGHDRNKKKTKKLIEKSFQFTEAKNISSKFSDDLREAESFFKQISRSHLKIKRDSQNVIVIIGLQNTTSFSVQKTKYSQVKKAIILTYSLGYKSQKDNGTNQSEPNFTQIGENGENISVNTFSRYFNWAKNETFNERSQTKLTVPYKDYFSGENVITICAPVIVKGFRGAACSDIRVVNQLEEMTLVPGVDDAYGFIIDNGGRAIIHRRLLPSIRCTQSENCEDATYEDITRLEQNEDVQEVLQSMVNMREGKKKINGELIYSTGHWIEWTKIDLTSSVKTKEQELLYIWSPIASANLSFALVLPLRKGQVYNMTYECKNEKSCNNIAFNYHQPEQLFEPCIYFGALAQNHSTIKFSASAFKDAYSYRLSKNHNDPITEALKRDEYLYELFQDIRINETVFLSNATGNVWKENPLPCFVGIRFMGTENGVMITYPGLLQFSPTYDPRERPWYQMALSNREKNIPTITLTTPYKDYFSGGMVHSVAFPLEYKPNGSPEQVLVGVVGGDYTHEFLMSELIQRLPLCKKILTCFFMDNMGYIVFHFSKLFSEVKHIIEVEFEIAKTLEKKEFLTRNGCHDYERDVVVLYWEFNLPPWSNFYDGNYFTIRKIPFMNIFLVVRKIGKRQNFAPKSNKDCTTSCYRSSHLDIPCRLISKTNCTKENGHMNIDKLPPCWPSNQASRKETKEENCGRDDHKHCFDESGKRECEKWLINCP